MDVLFEQKNLIPIANAFLFILLFVYLGYLEITSRRNTKNIFLMDLIYNVNLKKNFRNEQKKYVISTWLKLFLTIAFLLLPSIAKNEKLNVISIAFISVVALVSYLNILKMKYLAPKVFSTLLFMSTVICNIGFFWFEKVENLAGVMIYSLALLGFEYQAKLYLYMEPILQKILDEKGKIN